MHHQHQAVLESKRLQRRVFYTYALLIAAADAIDHIPLGPLSITAVPPPWMWNTPTT